MSIPKVDFSEFSGRFYYENESSQKWPQNRSKRPLAMRNGVFKFLVVWANFLRRISSRVGNILQTFWPRVWCVFFVLYKALNYKGFLVYFRRKWFLFEFGWETTLEFQGKSSIIVTFSRKKEFFFRFSSFIYVSS